MNPDTTPAALQAQVSGSSFYAGMRVLPRAEREAMYAIYGFCRMVDDIADDEVGPSRSTVGAVISMRSMPDVIPGRRHCWSKQWRVSGCAARISTR
jgi:phytoene/squalene synthetase